MSKTLKADVEPGFLEQVKKTADVVKEASDNPNNLALQALTSMSTAYAIKAASDSLKGLITSEKKEEEQKEEEKKKAKKKRDMLSVLFMLRRKGLIDDETFRNLVMVQLLSEGDGEGLNPLLFLMLQPTSSTSQQQPKKKSKMAKVIKKLHAEIKELKEQLKNLQEKPEKQEGGSSEGASILKSFIETNQKLIDTVLNSQLNKNPLDDLQKYADIITKLNPSDRKNAIEELTSTIELLNKLGVLKDETKQKWLELKKELIMKKLETEKEIKQMELEKEKVRAETELQVAQRQAEMIKGVGDMFVKSVIRGLIESQKPAVETQKVTQQQTQQTTTTQQPPPPPPQQQPQSVEMLEIAHTDEKGNILHEFKIPVSVLLKNETTIDGKKYYKVICPIDNQELYLPAEELEKTGGEGK